MNTSLDAYFQGKSISKSKLGQDIAKKALDIEICREVHIPYATSIDALEVSEYRFLSLFLAKERFWKNRQQSK